MIPVAECPVVFNPDYVYLRQMAALTKEASVNIVDDKTRVEAGETLKHIRQCKKEILAAAVEPKSVVQGWLNAINAKIKQYTEPLDAADKRLASGILAFDADIEKRRKAAQEEAFRKLEAERKRQEDEHQVLLASLNPWDDVPPPPSPVVVAIPVIAPLRDTFAGVRNKPWQGRVTDVKAFLLWVAANIDDRQGLIIGLKREEEYLVSPALNAKAKELGESMGKIIPGTEAFRERTVSTR